jgi:hypothetical protein
MPEQDSIAKSYSETSLGWQQANLKIVNKKSQLVDFDHNIAQLKVNNAMQLQIENNLPVMLIILKARQEGISTYIEACIFEAINRNMNRHGCVVSADKDATEKVFRMCKTFQDEMPTDNVLAIDKSNAKEIKYQTPHRSSMLCQTAGKKILGRGGTTQYVHATEVAFWANAKVQLNSLLQEVPDEPGTMVAQESTANGVGGAFHDEYWDAVKRLKRDPHDYRGYLPIFLSWMIFPEYQTALPKGMSDPPITQDFKEYVRDLLSIGKSPTPEQIFWAFLKYQNRCGSDIDLFKQEYPVTARQAFQATGNMVFKTTFLDIMETRCRKEPKMYVEFYMDGRTVKYKIVTRSINSWAIWEWPEPNHSYVEFGDVAEGCLADPNDPKSTQDRSVACVLDRNAFNVPATYYGRPDTIVYGDQMLMAAKFYNYAWASPEMNSIGQSVLDTFKRDEYEYIYYRETKEETDSVEDSKKLGWKTTTATRKPMFVDLEEETRKGDLVVFDIRFIDEMRVCIKNAVGKWEARKGEHDDCIIALGGALQLHKRCPVDDNHEWANKETPGIVQGKLMIANTYDDEDDLDDGDDDNESMFEDMSEYE